MIQLDLIIATYNRPELLAQTLRSIAESIWPADLVPRVIVVDNNSTPLLRQANQNVVAQSINLNILYLMESRQGKSWALNTGLEYCHAEYVAFIDDDETLDTNWFEVASAYLREGRIDYFGGPYKPNWEAKAPAWLPMHVGKYRAVLGWIEQNDKALPFDDFGGSLCGGNCVIRRTALLEIGGFSTEIGRSANNLMGGEDDDLQYKLRNQGKLGMYDPALIIYHLIPSHRMTRSYHMRWAFWSGVSNGIRLSWLPAEPVAILWGLPRYRYAQALSGVWRWLSRLPSSSGTSQAEGFAGLLDTMYLCGLLYGRHFLQPAAHAKLETEKVRV